MCFFPPTNKLQQLYLYNSPTNVKNKCELRTRGPVEHAAFMRPQLTMMVAM